MLLALALFSLSFDDQCIAPLKTAPVLGGKTIKFVQVLTRHGARTPLVPYLPVVNRGYWLCDSEDAIAPRMHAAPVEHFRRFKQVIDQRLVEYLPNCRSGDLILTGMEQHRKLGQFYHEYLYNTHKLLSELPPNPKNLYVRCSDVERTFRSAQSFLHGLFPPQSPDEIIEINTDTSDGSLLRVNKDWCKDMKNIWVNHTASAVYNQWVDENWIKIQDLASYFGLVKSGDNLNSICDFVTTNYCSDKRVPTIITPDIQQVCLNVTGSYIYDYYAIDPIVTASYTMRELMRIPKQIALGNSSVKFSLMSSHDTTVAAVLSFLGERRVRIPPYASHLTSELWEDDASKQLYIRFVFNGEEVRLREFNGESVALFSEFLDKYNRMNDVCKDIK